MSLAEPLDRAGLVVTGQPQFEHVPSGMHLEAELVGERADRLLQRSQRGVRVVGLAAVDDEREPLVLDPQRRVGAVEQLGQALLQGADLVGGVRSFERAVVPGLDAVDPGDDHAGYALEPAEPHDGLGVASGDHRHLRTRAGEVGEHVDRAVDRLRLLRVADERRERAVEVGGHQHVRHEGTQCGGDLGQLHPSILPFPAGARFDPSRRAPAGKAPGVSPLVIGSRRPGRALAGKGRGRLSVSLLRSSAARRDIVMA